MRRAAVTLVAAWAMALTAGILWWQSQQPQRQLLVRTEDALNGKLKVVAASPASSKLLESTTVSPVSPVSGPRVAVLVVGQWRYLTSDVSERRGALRSVSVTVVSKLKGDGVSSVLSSQVVHVLQPLRQKGARPDYLLCVDQVKGQNEEIAEAWAFAAKDQVQRIKECLKRVMEREIRLNTTYDFFVRLRPDLLMLSKLPSPYGECVWARLRAARHIQGLSSEHLSWCYCGQSCCAKGVLKSDTPAYIADDMVMIASRESFLRLYQKVLRSRELGPGWSMAPMAETSFTVRIKNAGLSLCPLRLRAIPIGSANPHAVEMSKCGYLEGSPAVAQTQCGLDTASVETAPW